MRVLLIDQYSELGGAQRCLLEAAAGFALRGWELHAALPEGPLSARLATLGARIVPMHCGPFRSARKAGSDALRFAAQLPGQVATIARVADQADIEVFYVNGPRVAPAAVLAARDRPAVFHCHSVVTQRSAARVLGRAIRSHTSLLACSRSVSDWLRALNPAQEIRVIYNGIEGFAVTPKRRERFTRIAVLGRIAPEKGQAIFVQAARIASRENPDLRYVVCGGSMFGPSEYYDQVRAAAGVEVSFEEWTEDVGAFFERIDVLAVPSEGIDASPRVILEAYAAGVPVIAFDSPGIAELIEQGKSGLLVQERLPQALARAMLDAVADPPGLNEIAHAGYERWRERYTLGRFQSDVAEALEDAVRRHRQPLHKAEARALP